MLAKVALKASVPFTAVRDIIVFIFEFIIVMGIFYRVLPINDVLNILGLKSEVHRLT